MEGRVDFIVRTSNVRVCGEKQDEVVVLRNGREVATLRESDRLNRALSLSLDETEWIANNFETIMHRQPTRDEAEFWRAVVDFKRFDARRGSC